MRCLFAEDCPLSQFVLDIGNHLLIDAMLYVREGDTVTLLIARDGKEMSKKVTITKDCLEAY